ncbi:MAG: hypothetical protein ACK56I_02425 [bacterium]
MPSRTAVSATRCRPLLEGSVGVGDGVADGGDGLFQLQLQLQLPPRPLSSQ